MADDAHQKAEDHYYAALDLVAEGEQERALAEYEQSLAADPVFTEAMHGMARTLQDLNRLDEAIVVAKRIAELDPRGGRRERGADAGGEAAVAREPQQRAARPPQQRQPG